MAGDVVTSQVTVDGERNYVITLTNLSDGTGENVVKKVDITTMHPVPTSLRLEKVQGDVAGMNVALLWGANTKQKFLELSDSQVDMDMCEEGGLPDPKATGFDGCVYLTTANQAAGSSYTLHLHFKKKFVDGRYVQE